MDINMETKSETHSQSAPGQPEPGYFDTGQPQPAPEQSISTPLDSSQLDISFLDTGQSDTHQLDQSDSCQPNGTNELHIAQSNAEQVEHSTLECTQPYTRENQQEDTPERSDASIACSDVPHISAKLHIVTKGLSSLCE